MHVRLIGSYTRSDSEDPIRIAQQLNAYMLSSQSFSPALPDWFTTSIQFLPWVYRDAR